MLKMRSINWCHLVPVVCLLLISTSSFVSSHRTQTALRCGVYQDQPPQRTFADPGGKRDWREYPGLKDIPELELGFGESARLWVGLNGNLLIATEEPGEDFTTYTDYCFNNAGKLVQLRFELRTAWGWGYRREGPIIGNALVHPTSDFFSTTTGMRITKPQQADDIADALIPRLYLLKNQLPFSLLLLR
jgi:hypothetical protein